MSNRYDEDEGGFAPLPDEFRDYEERARRSRSNRTGANLLTLVFLLATFGACGLIITIWNNPYSAVNPFPPDTPFPMVITETPIATAIPSATTAPTRPPTEIPTITLTPTETMIPVTLTFTPIPPSDLGLTLGTPGASGDPSVPPTAVQPFVLQVLNSQQVFYITNPDGRGGCNWASLTGTVIGLDGSGVIGYGVHITGEGIDQTVATGSETSAGPGGWEHQLGDAPRDATYTVQLLDPSGSPASEPYQVRTVDDCSRNIAAVRFIQVGS